MDFIAADMPNANTVMQVAANSVPNTATLSGWMYDSTSGNVYINSTLIDSKNIPYSYYGFE